MATNTERISKLEHTVYGNGEIGMDEMLRQVYQDMKERKKRDDEHQKAREDDRKFYRRAILTPILGSIGTFIIAIIMLIINGLIFLYINLPTLLPHSSYLRIP